MNIRVLLSTITVTATITALLFLFLGCATDLSDIDISELRLEITGEYEREVETLLPDREYFFDFTVTDAAGKLYKNPDYKDLNFHNLSRLRITEQAYFSIRIKTARETFHPHGEVPYRFTLSIEENEFPPKRYHFDLNWESFDTLDYSGSDGSPGRDEDMEKKIAGSSDYAVDIDGDNGESGERVRMLVTRYRYGKEEKLLFYETEKQHLYLSNVHEMTVDSSGGDGGRGGRMDFDTEDSLSYPFDSTPIIGYEYHIGGNGGDGGNGGSIELLYTDEGTADIVRLEADGGDGGNGGSGDRSGNDGREGFPGRTKRSRISMEKAKRILSEIDRPGFSVDRVIF